MPVISKEPKKYDLPAPGFVFQKEEQDGRWEFAIVDGVKVTYVEKLDENKKKVQVLSGWQASLTSGFRDYRGVITHTTTYQDSTQWHPAPAEKQASGVALALIGANGDELVRLGARTLALEEARLAEEEASEGLKKRIAALEAHIASATSTAAVGPAGPQPGATVAGERPRRGAG